MKKAIVFVRTSTDSQEMDSQKDLAVKFCSLDGYKEDEIEIIGTNGASAIKLDKIYLADIAKVYETMEKNPVEGVYLASLDRFARDEEIIVKMKKYCINNKIHLKIADMGLSLLQPNKEVNEGVNITLSILAAQAAIEMRIKKARMARGREKNAEIGKYNGGYICYGYEIDSDGFYREKESESKIIREIFELMASDKYSITTLTEELRSRGVMFHGRLINYQMVMGILKNTAYIGFSDKYTYKRKYPRLVSDELWQKARGVLDKNNTKRGKARKHYHFASLLIKCPECGRSYVGNETKSVYSCPSHAAPKSRRTMGEEICNNKLSVNIGHLDGLCWAISSKIHYEYIKGLDAVRRAEIESEIGILELKLKESPKLLEEIAERYERLDDVYLLGRMGKEKYNQKSKEIKSDEDKIKNDLTRYKEEISRLKSLLDGKDSIDKWFDDNFLMTQINGEENEKMMYELVHKYIKEINLKKTTVPSGAILSTIPRSKNTGIDFTGKNCVKIRITTVDSEEIEVYYLPMTNYSHKIYYFTEIEGMGRVFTGFDYEPILRENPGEATTRSIQTQKKFILEMGKVIEQAEDKRSTYSWLVKSILPGYGVKYTGDFNEPGEEAYRGVKEAFYQLHSLRNISLTLQSLEAVGRLYIGSEKDLKEEILKNTTL